MIKDCLNFEQKRCKHDINLEPPISSGRSNLPSVPHGLQMPAILDEGGLRPNQDSPPDEPILVILDDNGHQRMQTTLQSVQCETKEDYRNSHFVGDLSAEGFFLAQETPNNGITRSAVADSIGVWLSEKASTNEGGYHSRISNTAEIPSQPPYPILN